MREFIKSDDGMQLRALYAAGEPAPYFMEYGRKMAEFRKQLDPKGDQAAVGDYVNSAQAAVEEARAPLPGSDEWRAAVTPKPKEAPVVDPTASAEVRARNAEVFARRQAAPS